MSFKLNGLRLAIVGSVGEVTSIKVKKVQEILGKENYSLLGAADNAPIKVLLSPATNEQCVLAPDQVLLVIEGEELDIQPDYKKVESNFEKIKELFMFEEKTLFNIHLFGTFQIEDIPSTMKKSLDFTAFDKEGLETVFPTISGVGLRFLLNHGKDIWEVKLEPLFKNNSLFYVEAICGSSEPADLETIINETQLTYNKISTDFYQYCSTNIVK